MKATTVKRQKMETNRQQVIETMKGVTPDRLHKYIVAVSGVTYPVKQVYSTVFGVPRAEFISDKACNFLRRAGFKVRRIIDA